ncbi:MAG: serine/threonine protein kinase, partial [Acidobacteria bacterium]|nr:serine/threonine protein kinase [Acidobacteriota bacterium]
MTESPAIIGRYHVARLIAHGGMGTLYLARDPSMDRLIAIKLLREGFEDDEMRERFAREARATGRLRHPNIVTVFDVGEHENRPFIAMEYVPGETLEQLIRRRARVTIAEKLAILEDLCAALHHAHGAGIVHRDIKPANVMLEDVSNTLKVLDFGIAHAGESGLTNAGEMVGTLNYMSPEQIAGDNVDHRTDVYAVGVLAYELLAYRKAFPGTIQDGALFRILHSVPEPLDTIVADLDPGIAPIVESAMAREPALRYQDMERLRQDLAEVRSHLVERGGGEFPSVSLDPESETIIGPAEGSPTAQSPTPRNATRAHPLSGSRGSSAIRRGTSASSARARLPSSGVRGAIKEMTDAEAPQAAGAGSPRRRKVLVTLVATAAALILVLSVSYIGIGSWGSRPTLPVQTPVAPPQPAPPAALPTPTTPRPQKDQGDDRRMLDEHLRSIRTTARRQTAAG